MATRRNNGEGSITELPDGRFQGRIRYTDPDSGQWKRVRVYGATKKQVRAEMNKVLTLAEDGGAVRDARRLIGDYLAQWRTTTLEVSDRSEATKELYCYLSRVHLENSAFGRLRLDQVRAADVEKLILALRAATKTSGKGEAATTVRALSDSTIRSIYTVARAGLDAAVRDGLLIRNPVAQVKRPGVTQAEVGHLDHATVQKILAAAEGSRYYPVLALTAYTGMRRGEVMALCWDQVDLDAGVLRVEATLGRVRGQLRRSAPKTARSRRAVPLHPAMVTMLRRHRTEQLREQLAAGNKWATCAETANLVFTTELGYEMEPSNSLRAFRAAAAKVIDDPKAVNVHTLRHTAAETLFENKAHIKTVADILGHSSVAITGDIYGHTADPAARAAMLVLGDALGAK